MATDLTVTQERNPWPEGMDVTPTDLQNLDARIDAVTGGLIGALGGPNFAFNSGGLAASFTGMTLSLGGPGQRVILQGVIVDVCPANTYAVPTGTLARTDLIAIKVNRVAGSQTISRNVRLDSAPATLQSYQVSLRNGSATFNLTTSYTNTPVCFPVATGTGTGVLSASLTGSTVSIISSNSSDSRVVNVLVYGLPVGGSGTTTAISLLENQYAYQYITGSSGTTPATPAGYEAFATVSYPANATSLSSSNITYLFPQLAPPVENFVAKSITAQSATINGPASVTGGITTSGATPNTFGNTSNFNGSTNLNGTTTFASDAVGPGFNFAGTNGVPQIINDQAGIAGLAYIVPNGSTLGHRFGILNTAGTFIQLFGSDRTGAFSTLGNITSEEGAVYALGLSITGSGSFTGALSANSFSTTSLTNSGPMTTSGTATFNGTANFNAPIAIGSTFTQNAGMTATFNGQAVFTGQTSLNGMVTIANGTPLAAYVNANAAFADGGSITAVAIPVQGTVVAQLPTLPGGSGTNWSLYCLCLTDIGGSGTNFTITGSGANSWSGPKTVLQGTAQEYGSLYGAAVGGQAPAVTFTTSAPVPGSSGESGILLVVATRTS